MKLLTAELRAGLPALYAQEKVPDPIVHAKFFTPDSNWTWYVTEGGADEKNRRELPSSGTALCGWFKWRLVWKRARADSLITYELLDRTVYT